MKGKSMKNILLLALVAILGGCATHAKIGMPAVTQVHHKSFENKSMSYEVMYSQPKPGIFSGGQEMPLVPLEEAELSVASAATLKNLPEYIFRQVPSSVERAAKGESDLKLIVELKAYDKKGPAYADYELAKSFFKDLVTLGFSSSEYNIVADFDAKYVLLSGDKEVLSKSYKIDESVDHERGDFESYGSLNEYVGQLLEKHFILTLNDFFKESAGKM